MEELFNVIECYNCGRLTANSKKCPDCDVDLYRNIVLTEEEEKQSY